MIRQQKNRSSKETRRLTSGNQRRATPSRNAIASSVALQTDQAEKEKEEEAKGEDRATAFTEEDFQNFFQSYKPTKPQ